MFFQTFFYACGGAVVYAAGVFIREAWRSNQEDELHKEYYDVVILFTGAGIAMLFYVSVLCPMLVDLKYAFVRLFSGCHCCSGRVSEKREMIMKMHEDILPLVPPPCPSSCSQSPVHLTNKFTIQSLYSTCSICINPAPCSLYI